MCRLNIYAIRPSSIKQEDGKIIHGAECLFFAAQNLSVEAIIDIVKQPSRDEQCRTYVRYTSLLLTPLHQSVFYINNVTFSDNIFSSIIDDHLDDFAEWVSVCDKNGFDIGFDVA